MFAVLGKILGFYSNFAIAWVVVVATDISINKYVLKLSPKEPEYRRDMLLQRKPCRYGCFPLYQQVYRLQHSSDYCSFLAPYSPIIALVLAFVLTPIMGLLTKGKYYIKSHDDGVKEPRYDAEGTPVATVYHCRVCEQGYERPDIMFSHKHNGTFVLCKTLDA